MLKYLIFNYLNRKKVILTYLNSYSIYQLLIFFFINKNIYINVSDSMFNIIKVIISFYKKKKNSAILLLPICKVKFT